MIVSRTARLPRKKLLLATLDALCVGGALLISVLARLGWTEGLSYCEARSTNLLLVWAVFPIMFYIGGLYENDRLKSIGRVLAAAAVSVSLAALVVSAVFFATLSRGIGRGIFFGFTVAVFGAITFLRILYLEANRRGFMAPRCLVIGTNGQAKKVIELVHQHPHSGLKILGLIHCGPGRDAVGQFFSEYPVLGTLDTLEKFIDLYDIDRLILATTVEEEPVLLRRLRPFRYRGLVLVDFVTLYEELAHEIPLEHINDEWLFMAANNNSHFHIRRLKRLIDIVVSLLVLVPASVLVLPVAALLIKLTSRGPVLFRQERLGRDSKPFVLLKLRTMDVDAEQESGPVWSTENDPRVTSVGKLLRKFRIDEIPQLVNVLRGDMSLVGPRPEREVFIKQLSESLPYYAERLLVPPGVTGWAQVMAPYAASVEDSRRKLQFDLYYIKHMSFFLDLVIFGKTAKTIVFGRERRAKSASAAQVLDIHSLVAEPGNSAESKPAAKSA